MNSSKIVFIVGPTSVGKTAVSLELAHKLEGEIISCDAMQVYKEISIASNKPSWTALREIRHHLIDIVSVEEEFDVAYFRRAAVLAIEDIFGRGKFPVIVGGSGLYMSVLWDGIFEGGGKDEDLRKELQSVAQQKGTKVLYQKLLDVDPAAAQKIHPNDTKRIIRALEIFEIKREPISSLQKQRFGLWGKYDIRIFALNRPREELYELINRRVEAMFEEGLVSEIKGLSHLHLSQTAQNIIGIQEVRGFLNGEYDLDRARYLMKLNTRHYAKRQLTWFRKDHRLHWIMMSSKENKSEIVSQIIKEINL